MLIMLYVVLILSVVGGWVLISIYDIESAAKMIFNQREEWKKTKGGIKPSMKWGNALIRSVILLIVGILLICIVPELAEKIGKLISKGVY